MNMWVEMKGMIFWTPVKKSGKRGDTTDFLKPFSADVAAGVHGHIDDEPRFSFG